MNVTLYSQASCGPCIYTERWMKTNGIDYDKVRIDQDDTAAEFIKSLGHSRTPVIVVKEDDEVVDSFSGFSEARLKALAAG